MAVVFTVETGAIVAGANSYVTVTEADDYFSIDPNFGAAWAALDTADKEQLLMWSTRILDQKAVFFGNPVSTTQPLRWPRTGARTRDGEVIENTTVPLQVRQAVAELLKYARTNDPTIANDVQRLRRILVDVIEIEYQEGDSQYTVPSIINIILDGVGVYRVGRAGNGRIRKSG
jgi:hypothetical protein